MAVHAYDEQFGVNGHGDSMAQFIEAHRSNTDQILNLAEGKKKTAPRPAYDPDNPDNQWPKMVHSAKGELTVGKSLVGVQDPAARKRIEAANKEAFEAALKGGYRMEPYLKPQVVVPDAAVEKAALLKHNADLSGTIVQQNDQLARLTARLEALEQGAPAPQQSAPAFPKK